MTPEQVRNTAIAALRQIAKEKPGVCYAGRRGIAAGIQRWTKSKNLIFRKVDGRVRMELWSNEWSNRRNTPIYPLPADLQQRATEVLDRV